MKDYKTLLRKQVNEEIDYLVRHGHDVKHPSIPCMFCNDFKGLNYCRRLHDLRQFQQRLNMDEGTTAKTNTVPHEVNLPFLPS